jgi:uncharacterized LabA/DUF88 family protein
MNKIKNKSMYKISEIFAFNQESTPFIPTNLEKVMVFIDAEYVIQSMRILRHKPQNVHIGINDIFWEKIIERLVGARINQGVIYYSSELDRHENPETYLKQKNYLQKIKNVLPDITFRLGKMQKVKIKSDATWDKTNQSTQQFIYTWVQKGIDVKMSIDLILRAIKNEYETAILIAGDSDFEEVIREVKALDKKVELVTFDRYDCGVVSSFTRTADLHTKISYESGRKELWREAYRLPK